jgi:hypothetical protein
VDIWRDRSSWSTGGGPWCGCGTKDVLAVWSCSITVVCPAEEVSQSDRLETEWAETVETGTEAMILSALGHESEQVPGRQPAGLNARLMRSRQV